MEVAPLKTLRQEMEPYTRHLPLAPICQACGAQMQPRVLLPGFICCVIECERFFVTEESDGD
jgi:hypothetical protein